MLFLIFLVLFLPCVGMSAVFVVYMCLLWFAANRRSPVEPDQLPVKQVTSEGLSASDLDKLPKTSGKELKTVTECAVCLDEIEAEQPVRVVPGCNHVFHLQCADTWLSKHSRCPVCRTKLQLPHQFVDAASLSDENPC